MIFDHSYFQEVTSEDAELQQELLARFQTTLESCTHRLQQESDNWTATLHELRGASMAMGALELAKHCQTGEHHTPENPQEYLEQLSQLANNTVETIRTSLAA